MTIRMYPYFFSVVGKLSIERWIVDSLPKEIRTFDTEDEARRYVGYLQTGK